MSDLSPYLGSLKGKRILGINPPVHDFAFFDLWAKPLGLLYILGMLRNSGNDVGLLDCIQEAGTYDRRYGRKNPYRTEIAKPSPYADIPRRYWHFGLNSDEFIFKMKEKVRPDLILITSAMTYWYPGTFWCIRMIKRLLPDVPIILGGIYPVLCPEHSPLSGADLVQTVPMPLPASRPAVDLYGKIAYGVSLTSTGCPRRCSYCASSILWPEFCTRRPEDILCEIADQVCLGALDIAFYDDALLFGKETRFLPLCGEIGERFPGIRFHTPNGLHVKEIDHICARALFQAGFQTIRLSLEGDDPVNRKAGNMKTTAAEYSEAVFNLVEAGFPLEKIETYILAGLPGQTAGEVAENINFVRCLGARPKLALYSPIPGTRLFREVASRHPQVALEPLLQNNTVYAPYISGEMTGDELQQLKDLARQH